MCAPKKYGGLSIKSSKQWNIDSGKAYMTVSREGPLMGQMGA